MMYKKEELRENMVKLLKGIRILNVPVSWIEQYPQGLGPTIPELGELMEDKEPFEKMCFSSCRQPDFMVDLHMTGRDQVIVMGIETHVCVYQTVLGLLNRGFDVRVVADAVSSRTQMNYETGLRAMESFGAKITTVEMALFELLEEAGSEEFRKISRLIK